MKISICKWFSRKSGLLSVVELAKSNQKQCLLLKEERSFTEFAFMLELNILRAITDSDLLKFYILGAKYCSTTSTKFKP